MGLNQKYLMIHADDAGLSHSENQATMTCLKKGMVNSYSIMVPCRGFEEMANFAKENPKYDYGIHLTMTCEWHSDRFGPVLPFSNVPSLVDENGHFHKKRDVLRKYGKADDVYAELKAQIETALDFGLRPSHFDSHMFSVGSSPEFFEIYKELGKEYRIPVMINPTLLEMVGLSPKEHVNDGDFIVDNVHLATFDGFQRGHLKTIYLAILDKITPGLNILLIHPAFDDDEMKRLTVDHPNFGSVWRQMDYETFTDAETQHKLEENNIKLIDWRTINDLLLDVKL